VDLDDTYFVIDGHHRISVAKMLGQREIEAEVTVWRKAALSGEGG
jgi:ParB-like chromosome segregation protein Spo0J